MREQNSHVDYAPDRQLIDNPNDVHQQLQRPKRQQKRLIAYIVLLAEMKQRQRYKLQRKLEKCR